jgi:hypothetical protein
MRRVWLFGVIAIACGLGSAAAQERIGFGYSAMADGNCGNLQRTLAAEYGSTSDVQTVRGLVRSEPSGGDCRVESFAYSVRVARYFEIEGVDATVEFSAAQETVAAPYVLAASDGRVLLRGDGGALYGTNLPAGSAQTVVAAAGVSRRWGILRVGALVNLAPTEWVDAPAGRTVRLTWDAEHRGVYVEGAFDKGTRSFGVLSTGYRHSLADSPFDVSAGVTVRWGLTSVDNGAPLSQRIAGASFLRDGSPQDHSVITAVTLGYRLGD